MVQLHAGHWGFPKGHGEVGEEPLDTAIRELVEETGLRVKQLLSPDPIIENYTFVRDGTTTTKEVSYFLAEVEGTPGVQLEEVADAGWFSVNRASERGTFQPTKDVAAEVVRRLSDFK